MFPFYQRSLPRQQKSEKNGDRIYPKYSDTSFVIIFGLTFDQFQLTTLTGLAANSVDSDQMSCCAVSDLGQTLFLMHGFFHCNNLRVNTASDEVLV